MTGSANQRTDGKTKNLPKQKFLEGVTVPEAQVKRNYQSAEAAVKLIVEASRRGESVRVTRDGDIAIREKPTNAFLLWVSETFGRDGRRAAKEENVLKNTLANKMKIDLASASTHAGQQLRKLFDDIESVTNKGSVSDLCTQWIKAKNTIQQISMQREEIESYNKGILESLSGGKRHQRSGNGASPSVKQRLPRFSNLEAPPRQTKELAITRDLTSKYHFPPDEAAMFARELHLALTELNYSFRDLQDFRMLLQDKSLMPINLSKKTQFSVALAALQQLSISGRLMNVLAPKDEQLFKATKIVSQRVEQLPLLQRRFPDDLRIDCVHQGATHYQVWQVPPEEFGQINDSLKSQSKYPKTTNPVLLKSHPRLGALEAQFGIDYSRYCPEFRVNGKIEPAMSEATRVMREALAAGDEEDTERAKAHWIKSFFDFFGNENAASLASHYLSQTTLGTLLSHWLGQGRPYIDTAGKDQKFEFSIDLVDDGKQKKCIIEASSIKNGVRAAMMLPTRQRDGVWEHSTTEVPLLKLDRSNQYAIDPSGTDIIRLEFDVEEMSNRVFKPKIVEGQFIRRIRIDWDALEEELDFSPGS